MFPIDSCMNIQCSSHQPSAAAPQTVPLFPINSCMNIQCSVQFFSPAPSAQKIKNLFQRLRRNIVKIFSGAFGAKGSTNSLAPSAQNVKKMLLRLRRNIVKIFFWAFGATCSKISPAPLAHDIQNFLLHEYTVHQSAALSSRSPDRPAVPRCSR